MTDLNDVVDVTTAAVEEVTVSASNLGLTWDLKPGTVVVANPLLVQYDGDGEAIGMTSMVGPLSQGDRVFAVTVPPAGNFVVGSMTGNQIGLLVGQDSDNSANTSLISAETEVFTLSFQAVVNHAYQVLMEADMGGTVASIATNRVRRDTVAGTELGSAGFPMAAAGGTTHTLWTFNIIATATDSITLSGTTTASAGSVLMVGSATDVRRLEVRDLGAASQYPTAFPI